MSTEIILVQMTMHKLRAKQTRTSLSYMQTPCLHETSLKPSLRLVMAPADWQAASRMQLSCCDFGIHKLTLLWGPGRITRKD